MIDASWSCPDCDKSFATFDQIQKHKVVHEVGVTEKRYEKISENEPVMGTIQEKTTKKIPVSLTYKYVGTCNSCGSQVETILIELDGKKSSQVAVAWCLMCKKKVEERTVTGL